MITITGDFTGQLTDSRICMNGVVGVLTGLNRITDYIGGSNNPVSSEVQLTIVFPTHLIMLAPQEPIIHSTIKQSANHKG